MKKYRCYSDVGSFIIYGTEVAYSLVTTTNTGKGIVVEGIKGDMQEMLNNAINHSLYDFTIEEL